MKKKIAWLMMLGTSLVVAGCSIGQNGWQGQADRKWPPDMPADAKALFDEMRQAREEGNTGKILEIKKEIDAKYPNQFGSGAGRWHREQGYSGDTQTQSVDTVTSASGK